MSQHTEGWRRSAHRRLPRRLPRLCAGMCAGPCCEWAGVVLAAVGFESLGVSGDYDPGELGSAAALDARSGPSDASKSSKCNGGFILMFALRLWL